MSQKPEPDGVADRVRCKIEQYLAWNADPTFEPCPRCHGKGYHHGFGEKGADPDWCLDCGGPGEQPTEPGTWSPDDLLREALEVLAEGRSAPVGDEIMTKYKDEDNVSRVDSQPLAAHGDLPRRATGPSERVLPETGTRRIVAIEIKLTELVVDESTTPWTMTRNTLRSHYFPTLTEDEARALYEACDVLLHAPIGEVLLCVKQRRRKRSRSSR